MIQQIIAGIVAGLTVEGSSPAVAPTFIHGWKGFNNLVLDEIQNTVVVLFEPVRSEDKLLGNYVQESYPLLLAILEKAEFDNTPSQHLPVVDRCRRLKNKLLFAIKESSVISDAYNINTEDWFNAYNSNLSGVGIQITVVPLRGNPVC